MTLYELQQFLHDNKFIERDSGILYSFIETTLNVGGKPLSNYSLYEENHNFYMKGTGVTTDYLLLTVYKNGISFTGKTNNRSYFNLLVK